MSEYDSSVTIEEAAALRKKLERAEQERDEARAAARILAHAYKTDNRPPEGVVQEALAYPVRPGSEKAYTAAADLRETLREVRDLLPHTGASDAVVGQSYKHFAPTIERRIEAALRTGSEPTEEGPEELAMFLADHPDTLLRIRTEGGRVFVVDASRIAVTRPVCGQFMRDEHDGSMYACARSLPCPDHSEEP